MECLKVPHAGPDVTWLSEPAVPTIDYDLAPVLAAPKSPPRDPRVSGFEMLPMPALLVGEAGQVVACNEAAALLIGWPAASVIGEPWWLLLSPRGRAGGGAERTMAVLRSATGDRIVTLHRILPQRPEEPMLVLVDQAQAADVEAPAEDTMLLEVAHDLRSLLFSLTVSLAGVAELAQQWNGDTTRLLNALRRSAVHLQAMLENLLDTASINSRQFSLRREEMDLGEVIHEAMLVVDPLLAPNEQHFCVELPAEPLIVHCDGQRLRQVLVNLLHNAIKYGPRGESIRIRACSDSTTVHLEVIDCGPGIPEEEQSRLFERFYRAPQAIRTAKGSGLGLTIARSIVHAHGGTIGVRSAPGLGTTFWFTLPAA